MTAIIQIALLCGVMVTSQGQGIPYSGGFEPYRGPTSFSGHGSGRHGGGHGGMPPYRGAESGSFRFRSGGSHDVSSGAFHDGLGSSILSRGSGHVPDLNHSLHSLPDSQTHTDSRRRGSSRRGRPSSRRGSRRGGGGGGSRIQIIGGVEGYYGATGGRDGFPYMGGAGAGPEFQDGGRSMGVGNGIGTGSIQAYYQRRSRDGIDYSLGPNGPMIPPEAMMDGQGGGSSGSRASISRGGARGPGSIGGQGMGGPGPGFSGRPGIGGPGPGFSGRHGMGGPGPGFSGRHGMGGPGPGFSGRHGMGGPGPGFSGRHGMGGPGPGFSGRPGMGGRGFHGPGMGGPGYRGQGMHEPFSGGGYRGHGGGSMYGPIGGYSGMGGYPGSGAYPGAGRYPSGGRMYVG